MEMAQCIYTSKDVARKIAMKATTIRKYAQLLERQGYSFQKDNKNWRQFTDDDIELFKKICAQKNAGKTLDEAIDDLLNTHQNSQTTTSKKENEIPPALSFQVLQTELHQFIEYQQEFNQKVLQKLDMIETQRERDKNLMSAVNQCFETKRQMAADKEKRWWQLWRV